MGNQTTYAPWMAKPIRNVVKPGANASTHEPRAVTVVDSSRTFRAPIRSPRRASTGTARAETINWAASNQFTPASGMSRSAAMSL
jgi:hypothetical protein